MNKKFSEINVGYVIAVGALISAILFYFLMEYADKGDIVMVVLLGIAIGIIAIVLSKVVSYLHYYKQLKDL
ncbi:hypothetical protein [Methanohalophilus sp.]|uniref:hypothetical protein n=1 Tax=Methanohalophilus sp. TaxID=1966352 RepID=UPI0026077727|nr:hypothetical protein [Methanohalophilus sp.]MDK2893027.1 hypothetical protein [Methanohalophilus sp.]